MTLEHQHNDGRRALLLLTRTPQMSELQDMRRYYETGCVAMHALVGTDLPNGTRALPAIEPTRGAGTAHLLLPRLRHLPGSPGRPWWSQAAAPTAVRNLSDKRKVRPRPAVHSAGKCLQQRAGTQWSAS